MPGPGLAVQGRGGAQQARLGVYAERGRVAPGGLGEERVGHVTVGAAVGVVGCDGADADASSCDRGVRFNTKYRQKIKPSL